MPLPIYEIVTCALSVSSGVALLICIRYLATEFAMARRDWSITTLEAFRNVARFRLAIGFTVFLIGLWPIATVFWLALYVIHRGGDGGTWAVTMPYALMPPFFGAIAIVGMACIVRALIPSVWGRCGYVLICGMSAIVVLASQLLDVWGFIWFVIGGAALGALAWLFWPWIRR